MTRHFIARAGAFATIGAIALAAYAAVDDITLKLQPKVGNTAEYKINATFTSDQGDITLGQKRVEKVTELKSDGGFVVEIKTSETKISFGGQEIPEQPETTGTAEFDADGLVRKITARTAVEASSYKISNLHAFKIPAAAFKVGDEIKFEIPANKTNETPAVKSVYKVVGKEKFHDWDTVKFTFTSEETEGDPKASIKGTAWVDTATGFLVKTQEEWSGVQPAGAPFPLNGKYTSERVK